SVTSALMLFGRETSQTIARGCRSSIWTRVPVALVAVTTTWAARTAARVSWVKTSRPSRSSSAIAASSVSESGLSCPRNVVSHPALGQLDRGLNVFQRCLAPHPAQLFGGPGQGDELAENRLARLGHHPTPAHHERLHQARQVLRDLFQRFAGQLRQRRIEIHVA